MKLLFCIEKNAECGFAAMAIVGLSLSPRICKDTASFFNDDFNSVKEVARNSGTHHTSSDADISSLIGEDSVFLFPVDDILRNESLTSSKELLAQRLFVLKKSLEDKPKIVVTHATGILTPLATVNDFLSNSLSPFMKSL